jgi:hypothetical protein
MTGNLTVAPILKTTESRYGNPVPQERSKRLRVGSIFSYLKSAWTSYLFSVLRKPVSSWIGLAYEFVAGQFSWLRRDSHMVRELCTGLDGFVRIRWHPLIGVLILAFPGSFLVVWYSNTEKQSESRLEDDNVVCPLNFRKKPFILINKSPNTKKLWGPKSDCLMVAEFTTRPQPKGTNRWLVGHRSQRTI